MNNVYFSYIFVIYHTYCIRLYRDLNVDRYILNKQNYLSLCSLELNVNTINSHTELISACGYASMGTLVRGIMGIQVKNRVLR